MTTIAVDMRGRITLSKELRQHLGVEPGGKIEIVTLPHGRIEIRATKSSGQISDAFGMLKRGRGRALTVEQMSRVAARGWSGQR